MNKKGVILSGLIRPIAKRLVPTNKSQLRLRDDPDSESWNDYALKGEKVKINVDKLFFEKSVKILTWRGDVLKMITDYKFNSADSPHGKTIIDFSDETRFDTHARGKSVRDRNL